MTIVSKAVVQSLPLALLQRSLPGLTINTFIALSLTAFGDNPFGPNLVYSHCIGINIWLLIELSRRYLLPEPEQHWRRLYFIIPGSVVLGYVIGLYLAAWLLNYPTDGLWTEHPRMVLGYLLLSLTAGGALTYYFMSREQLAAASQEMAYAAAQTEAAQRHAAESRLVLLQSQLEPHMLFNTLANLRALIGTDPAAATAMLDHLNAYLRATLNASRASAHPLQTEFDRVRDYLELLKVRMGPRLGYTLELPDSLAGVPVPPLILQPLVENAIKHGLEPKIEGGNITVRASHKAGELKLEVSDSGVGLPEGRQTTDGFGLTQVRERLATIYGTRGTLVLTPGPGVGATASLVFPCGHPEPAICHPGPAICHPGLAICHPGPAICHPGLGSCHPGLDPGSSATHALDCGSSPQ
jgi:sensor histidine kinase YesM